MARASAVLVLVPARLNRGRYADIRRARLFRTTHAAASTMEEEVLVVVVDVGWRGVERMACGRGREDDDDDGMGQVGTGNNVAVLACGGGAASGAVWCPASMNCAIRFSLSLLPPSPRQLSEPVPTQRRAKDYPCARAQSAKRQLWPA